MPRRAGQRVELLVQRVGYAYGQPVVLGFHVGTPQEIVAARTQQAPLASQDSGASGASYLKGALQFDYAGARQDLPMTRPEFNPSTLTTHPQQQLAELNLFYGDATNLTARLRLRGLHRPGEYSGYGDFEGDLALHGTYIRLDPSVLRDCRLVIARLDAQGADGTLNCQRVATTSELVPTRFEFSARP